MFWSRYPQSNLKHVRILCSFGRERGEGIVPKPFATPPPERVHEHSCFVPLPVPGEVMVIEWTGDKTELHLVDV